MSKTPDMNFYVHTTGIISATVKTKFVHVMVFWYISYCGLVLTCSWGRYHNTPVLWATTIMESMDRPLRDILAETPEGDKGKLIFFCLETMSRSIIVEGSTRSPTGSNDRRSPLPLSMWPIVLDRAFLLPDLRSWGRNKWLFERRCRHIWKRK